MITEERPLTGLRVLVQKGGGLIYGVARVRYSDGHTHAGHYEIETADGASLLAPFDSCTVAANWDITPKEGRFTGSEIFWPAFLDGTRRAYLSTSPGVVVPGDMDRLRKLIERVKPGDSVNWVSHGCNEFQGAVTVASVDAKGFSLASLPKAPQSCDWPTEEDEFEVEGNTLHFVRVPSRRTGKHPSRSLSLTFRRPRQY